MWQSTWLGRLIRARHARLYRNPQVPIEYDVNLLSLSRPGTVVVVASTSRGVPGVLPAGQKETFRVRCRPGIPDILNETALFEIGPYEPVPLKVMMEGIYPGIYLTVPRLPASEEVFMEAMEAAQHTIAIDGPKLGISSMLPDRRARSVAPSMVRALVLFPRPIPPDCCSVPCCRKYRRQDTPGYIRPCACL